MEKLKLDLTMEEAEDFGNCGALVKRLQLLPQGIFPGARVQLGHWPAEVTSIHGKEGGMDRGFVVGFKMVFT